METALTPSDVERLAHSASQPRGKKGGGDLRIGAKMIEYRTMFGFPRNTVATQTGISETSIIRLELGERMFSTHSLANYLRGTQKLQKLIHPTRHKAYTKWRDELIDIVAEVEEAERINRRLRGERSYTTEGGRR